MADTNQEPAKTGGVVILGVQGSGKTVFLSVLGETFAEGGVLGLSLAGDPATEDFTAGTFRLMEWEHQFPESTDRTVSVPLLWTAHVGEQELFSLATLDCAGELIVDAFAPGAEKRESAESGENGDEENAFAEASRGSANRKTAIDRLRELVREAKVVCLFVNPNDFKRNQRQDGTRQQRDAAFNRYRDMDRLLDVFLRGDAAGSRPIIIVLTQTGDESLRSEIAYHGGPKGYLFDAYRKLRKMPRAAAAHVICVSAVNEEVQTGERTWEDDAGQTHVDPVMGPAPAFTSTGLIDFLLAVGGEVSAELAPLGRALHALREADNQLAQARFSGRPVWDRVEAAQALADAFKVYDDAIAAFLAHHSGARRFADDVRATTEHRAAEEAAALRWSFAESTVDAAIREVAYAGRSFAEEEDVVAFGREIAARINGGQPSHYAPVSADVLFPVSGWIRNQVREVGSRQATVREDFERALAMKDLAAARGAVSQGRKWYPAACPDLDEWSEKTDAMAKELARRDDFAAVDGHLEEASDAIARKAPTDAAHAIERAKEGLRVLAETAASWGDAGEVRVREGRVAELSDRRTALERELAACALAVRKERFRNVLDESLSQMREKVGDGEFAWVETEMRRLEDLAANEPWQEARGEVAALVGEVTGLVAARKAGRRKERRIVAACLALFLLGLWLLLRVSALDSMRANVAAARNDALSGNFHSAGARLSNVQDSPLLMIDREKLVDPVLARAVDLGIEDSGRLAAATKSATDLVAEVRRKFDRAKDEKVPELAPHEWQAALRELEGAAAALPKPTLGEFGLPPDWAAYQKAIVECQDVRKQAEEAQNRLSAATFAADKVRIEQKRRKDVEDLRRKLRDASPPQGWLPIAKALPANLGEWLILPDAELKQKWEAARRAGLSGGRTPADEGAWKAWDSIYGSFEKLATEAEKADFKNESDEAAVVMGASVRIREEQARRTGFAAELKSIRGKIGQVSFEEGERLISDLERKASLSAEKKALVDLRVEMAAVVVKGLEPLAAVDWRKALKELRLFAPRAGKSSKAVARTGAAIAKAAATDVAAAVVNCDEKAARTLEEVLSMEDEPLAAEVGKAMLSAIRQRWPRAKPDAEPAWSELVRLSAVLEKAGERGAKGAEWLKQSFLAWREDWLKEAKDLAHESASATRVPAKVNGAIETERRLAMILQGEKALKIAGNESFRAAAENCRGTLPPLLRVTVYNPMPDGSRDYVDADSAILSPSSAYYSAVDNADTHRRDAVVAMPQGSVVALSLKDDPADGSGELGLGSMRLNRVRRGMETFLWHGIRHIAVGVGKDEQDNCETPLDRLLAGG